MSIGDDLHADFAAFLAEFGRAVTIRRLTPGTYDPATGDGGTTTTKNYSGTGRLGNYSDALMDGTLIKQGDRRMTFQPDDKTFVPAIGDSAIVGASTFAVVNASKTREIGGTVFLYTLQLRQ